MRNTQSPDGQEIKLDGNHQQRWYIGRAKGSSARTPPGNGGTASQQQKGNKTPLRRRPKKKKNNSIGYRPPGDALAAVRVHRCVSAWLRNSLMAVYTQSTQRERIWKVGPSVFDYLDGGKLCAERERETNVKAFTCQRNNSILSLSACGSKWKR